MHLKTFASISEISSVQLPTIVHLTFTLHPRKPTLVSHQVWARNTQGETCCRQEGRTELEGWVPGNIRCVFVDQKYFKQSCNHHCQIMFTGRVFIWCRRETQDVPPGEGGATETEQGILFIPIS